MQNKSVLIRLLLQAYTCHTQGSRSTTNEIISQIKHARTRGNINIQVSSDITPHFIQEEDALTSTKLYLIHSPCDTSQIRQAQSNKKSKQYLLRMLSIIFLSQSSLSNPVSAVDQIFSHTSDTNPTSTLFKSTQNSSWHCF